MSWPPRPTRSWVKKMGPRLESFVPIPPTTMNGRKTKNSATPNRTSRERLIARFGPVRCGSSRCRSGRSAAIRILTRGPATSPIEGATSRSTLGPSSRHANRCTTRWPSAGELATATVSASSSAMRVMTSSSHASSPASSTSAAGSSTTSTTVKPATGSRSSMSTISDFEGSAPTTIVRCRKWPYLRSCRSHPRSAHRTTRRRVRPTTNVMTTNPRDRSSLRTKTTIATAPNTVAVADTTRLNSSDPTPRTRVS